MPDILRPFEHVDDSRLLKLAAPYDAWGGTSRYDEIAIWHEIEYRTSQSKIDAVAILDKSANECILGANSIGSIDLDAADFLISACQYLINPAYHERRDGSSNCLYMKLANPHLV